MSEAKTETTVTMTFELQVNPDAFTITALQKIWHRMSDVALDDPECFSVSSEQHDAIQLCSDDSALLDRAEADE